MVCFHPLSLEPSMWFAQSGCLVKLLEWMDEEVAGTGAGMGLGLTSPLICCVTRTSLSLSLSILTCERGTHTLTVSEIGLGIQDPLTTRLQGSGLKSGTSIEGKGLREAAVGRCARAPGQPRSRAFFFSKGNRGPETGRGRPLSLRKPVPLVHVQDQPRGRLAV